MKDSPLQKLREEKGLSQRQLAHSVGISRGRLRRLEGGGFEIATYSELKKICKTLGVNFEEILRSEGNENQKPLLRRTGESSFLLESEESGYRIVSLLPWGEDLFVGKLFLSPKRKLSPDESPHAKKLLLTILVGLFRIEVLGQSYELEAGDSLLFDATSSYTLENPLLRESVSFLTAIPGLALRNAPG